MEHHKTHKRTDNQVDERQNLETGEIDSPIAEPSNQRSVVDEDERKSEDASSDNAIPKEDSSNDDQKSYIEFSEASQSKGTSDSYVRYSEENLKKRGDSQILSEEEGKNIASSSSSDPTSFGAVNSELPSSYNPSVTDNDEEGESDQCTSDADSITREDDASAVQDSSISFNMFFLIFHYMLYPFNYLRSLLNREQSDTNDGREESIEDYHLEGLFGTENDENSGEDHVVHNVDDLQGTSISSDREVSTSSEDESNKDTSYETTPTNNYYPGDHTVESGSLVISSNNRDPILNLTCGNSQGQANERMIIMNNEPGMSHTPEDTSENSASVTTLVLSGNLSPSSLDYFA